jgi:hypothetical protein
MGTKACEDANKLSWYQTMAVYENSMLDNQL